MARFQISIRSTLLVFIAIAVLLATAIELRRRVNNFALNPYRVQGVAELLIEHMEETGQWPRGWDDLGRLVQHKGTDVRWSQWLKELRRNVDIDFSFDPATIKHLGLQDDPVLKVVQAYDGTLHGATADPNKMILCYLQEKLATSSEREQSDGQGVAD
jgi:hypothetical protein